LGVAAALAFYIMMRFRIKFGSFLMALIMGGLVFIFFQTQILMQLNRNKTDSDTDFDKHLKSMSNVRTDASNLERLNRWSCAWRMFVQKPVLGWGPGTYQFEYAPFQKPNEKTIISTNMHDVGGIHSEYFAPAVESGMLGFLAFLGVVLTSIACGMRAFYNAPTPFARLLSLAAVLGLVTYFVHGCLNNYLDSDKTAPLVWGFMAIIASIQIFHTPKNTL
jgi:O-antigen ligase